jgi:uncharacterized protein (TIRG00374 family)
MNRHHGLLALAIRQKRFVFAVVVLLLLYVVSPQLAAFDQSLDILSQASPLYVAASIILTALTYVLSAELYFLLVKHPVGRGRLLLVQVATALTSRLAPIGVGTIGLNILFLRRQKHTLPQAVAVAATNNGLGVIGHLLIIAVISTTSPLPHNFHPHLSESTVAIILLITAVLLLCLVFFRRLRRRLTKGIRQTLHTIAGYRRKPGTMLLALLVSMVISTTYVSSLAACSLALGVAIPFNEIFLIYTFSLVTGAATATPGGLVGVEAGLVAGFVAYGTDPSLALAIALLYRLVSYWLPLIPGLICLRAVQHRYF